MAKRSVPPPPPEQIEMILHVLATDGPSTLDALCRRTRVWAADDVLKFLIAAGSVVREVIATGERTAYHHWPVRRAVYRLRDEGGCAMNRQEKLDALRRFVNAAELLDRAWNEGEYALFLDHGYPFEESFEDILAQLGQWEWTAGNALAAEIAHDAELRRPALIAHIE